MLGEPARDALVCERGRVDELARRHAARSAAWVANGARASAMVSVSSSKSVSRSGAGAMRGTDAGEAPDIMLATVMPHAFSEKFGWGPIQILDRILKTRKQGRPKIGIAERRRFRDP